MIDHPCPFPDELVRRLVLLYSQEGDEILDPFLGSGQTARGALQNNRKCVGYEIEPKYIELACQRLYEPPRRKHQLLPKVEKQVIEEQAVNYEFRDGEELLLPFEGQSDRESKSRVRKSLSNLIQRYNTAIYENRFLAGGVVEIFTLALMRSTGIDIEEYGARGVGGI